MNIYNLREICMISISAISKNQEEHVKRWIMNTREHENKKKFRLLEDLLQSNHLSTRIGDGVSLLVWCRLQAILQ